MGIFDKKPQANNGDDKENKNPKEEGKNSGTNEENGQDNPGPITSKGGHVEETKASLAKGMVEVKFLKNHGTYKKNKKATYHKSTAQALAAHEIVEILEDK